MKYLILLSVILLASCKKESAYDPDAGIRYEHWYKTGRNHDTIFSVFFTNAFTPNGDGINDEYRIHGTYELKQFQIFDRTGQTIFETSDPNKSWNGKRAGGKDYCQTGSYVFKIELMDLEHNLQSYSGNMMLYR
ncbi:MAG: gliding motility-associated C-terminal domain-containing protein [Bacteroidota bacterium]|nr:gliding motility-associated C-terminal domain-containing protein [Bacteroidota bacterium]